jgi:hypothetical protein
MAGATGYGALTDDNVSFVWHTSPP